MVEGSRRNEPDWAREWLPPIVVYLAVLGVLLLVSWQVVSVVDPSINEGDLRFAGDWFWDGWLRWDGGWYRRIAEDGYSYIPGQQSTVAYFPGYPLVVRQVGRLVDNVPVGAMLTTIACGLTATVLFWRWSRARLDDRAALVALALFALYPYAWYLYGAVYGDALFVASALAAFLLLERDRPVLAGLAGLVATSTRLVGVAVVVGLVVLTLERRGALEGRRRFGLPERVRLRRLRGRDAGVLLAVAGFAAWSAWLWHRFGEPLLFWNVQEYWSQGSGPRTWFKVDFFGELAHGDRSFGGGLVLQAALAITVLALTPRIASRFGRAYAAYTFVLVAIPFVGSAQFVGLGRYCLAAFPAFALMGEYLSDNPRYARVALPACAVMLLIGTALFAKGTYLS